LLESIGDVDWIHQAVDAISLASDKVIRGLSSTQGVTQNQQPITGGACYAFPARTREELLANPTVAADAREIPPDEEPQNPVEAPVEKKKERPKGWLL
jgi:hypothetical protein